jgi:hypothetical protein
MTYNDRRPLGGAHLAGGVWTTLAWPFDPQDVTISGTTWLARSFDPDGATELWLSGDAGRSWSPVAAPEVELAVITATPFEASGTGREVCAAAMLAVQPNGYDFSGEARLHDDTTIDVDGQSRRLLVCTGGAAGGQGVVALVADGAGKWLLADLGLGHFVRAGDEAQVAVDGPRATITYRSLAGENSSTATTIDGGRTWQIDPDR